MENLLTTERLRELRTLAELRQEDMAVLLGVGIASVNRWERQGTSLPSGMTRQIYEVMDRLNRRGDDLSQVRWLLQSRGSMATVHWLLSQFYHDTGEST